MTLSILVVEDDLNLQEAISETLSLNGYQARIANSAEEAMTLLSSLTPDLVLSDINLGAVSGIDLLKWCHRNYPQLPIILMTAYSSVEGAVNALQKGAVDYLQKPFNPTQLLKKIAQYQPLQQNTNQDPVAEDPESKRLLALARRVAYSDASVLVSGESGTGKEVLARYIHDHSPRHDKPFVAVNCAAIPENMLEAILFGSEKGAYTGAYKTTAGKFEQAQHGTLLLDEVTEMPLLLQAKLLRVLQEREVERLGGDKIIHLDVRIVATTNRDLKEEVRLGRFREDLYYRLNVFPLHWIPLRKRPLDVLPLANYLLNFYWTKNGQPAPKFSEDAKQALITYHWPGNAREMANVIQRALILQEGDVLESYDFQLPLPQMSDHGDAQEKLCDNLRQQEFQLILEAWEALQGNRQQIADKLGISLRTLRYKLAKMREAGIEVPKSSEIADADY